MKRLTTVIAALGLSAAAAGQALMTRHIAAPPSDILAGVVVRPDPLTLGTSSAAATLPVVLHEGHDGTWRTHIPLHPDDPATTRLLIASPHAADWEARILPPSPCEGDATGDGQVNFEDLNAVLAAWGTPGPEGDVAPPGGNGIVDFDDLNLVLSQWGAACP